MQTNPELTPAILDKLKQQLEQKRRRLNAAISREQQREGSDDTEYEDPAEDVPGDSGDSSVDLQAWDDGHQTLVDLQADLGEVENALAKFDQGTYGLCEVCGRPIPLARLRVLPEARYDVEHQAEIEARQNNP
jgi:DnaK suppressor protein